MKRSVAVAIVALCLTTLALASQDEFCAGFIEGYKSIKGDVSILPVCPVVPVTPIGSTDFREGIKAGIRAAQR